MATGPGSQAGGTAGSSSMAHLQNLPAIAKSDEMKEFIFQVNLVKEYVTILSNLPLRLSTYALSMKWCFVTKVALLCRQSNRVYQLLDQADGPQLGQSATDEVSVAGEDVAVAVVGGKVVDTARLPTLLRLLHLCHILWRLLRTLANL